ncbi:MAG: type II toxin-antitoxin system HicA family toxin [Acidobacteriota bacterium]
MKQHEPKRPSWPSAKPKAVLSALQRIGWKLARQNGSHRTLTRPGWQNYIFAYHDSVEIGSIAMKKLGEKTGLKPSDL